jgi:hypothetical protein
MGGLIVPLYSTMAAPEDATPIEKCVAFPVPTVQFGKSTCAAGDTELSVTVNPALDRAPPTRA